MYLGWVEWVEEPIEHHLGEQELIRRAQLTGNPPLDLDNVRGGAVAQPPQHSLHALQLLHLQQRLGPLQLRSGRHMVGHHLRLGLNKRDILYTPPVQLKGKIKYKMSG